MDIVLKQFNLELIDLTTILQTISLQCLNQLHEYQLIKNNTIDLSKSDVRKIIYHNTIFCICEKLKASKNNNKKILIIQPKIEHGVELCQYCDCEHLNIFLHDLFKKIQSIFPIRIFFSKANLDFSLMDDNHYWEEGPSKELIHFIIQYNQEFENKRYTFEKAKKFTKKFGLTFLSEVYFDDLKIKQLLLR